MGKSRAEIQRACRERLKQKNKEEYLRRERERKNRSYVPSSELSENDRNRRNRKNKERLRRFYQRKKELRTRIQREQETSGYESAEPQPGTSDERGRLPIRFNFQNSGKRKGALKRWKRDISEAHSRIRLLEQERDKSLTKVKTAQRSYQRLRAKLVKDKEQILASKEQELTPRKRTEHIMEKAKLSEQQKYQIRMPLLVGNALAAEISETRKSTRKGHKIAIHRVVSGRILKKYICLRSVSARTGLCRHVLGKTSSKEHQVKPRQRQSKVEKNRDKIETFLKREDNSRTMPGKNDAKRITKGQKVQSHVLIDYLDNLHKKFLSENPDLKISRATFCRCRPAYILKASFTSRLSCLCTKHQNAALTIKALRKAGIEVNPNPAKAVIEKIDKAKLQSDLTDEIPVSQWTREEIEEKGKKKHITRTVEKSLVKEQFIEHVQNQMIDFESHVDRMKKQYEQIRHLKQNLPTHHMILQLDFAENYSCRSLEEVQSAYFNQTSVTLHPIVVYYKDDTAELTHKSYIIVSDEMSHKASTVMTFIDDIISELKKLDPLLNTIHYWSDSPSSQYRNKYIFNLIANHHEMYDIHAVWNNFESGHGKGPYDGLGGSCKRLADEAIRCGKYVIQDAKSFFKWAQVSNMKNVCFRFVSGSKCSEKEQTVSKMPVKAVNGTMKLHAVVGLGHGKILIRDVSCYCNMCLEGKPCDTWTLTMTRQKNMPSHQVCKSVVNGVSDSDNCNGTKQELASSDHEIGNFVAAVYDGKWYLGRIIDEDETEYEIDFIESKKGLFQWPRKKRYNLVKQIRRTLQSRYSCSNRKVRENV